MRSEQVNHGLWKDRCVETRHHDHCTRHRFCRTSYLTRFMKRRNVRLSWITHLPSRPPRSPDLTQSRILVALKSAEKERRPFPSFKPDSKFVINTDAPNRPWSVNSSEKAMSQKSRGCSLCREPNYLNNTYSEDVVTICQGCRAEINAFTQDTRTKIASYPQSDSDVQACIAEIESSMTFLATRNDFVYWQFQRAHLVGEIGQLLLDGKITPSGFRNLVKVLPSETHSRWILFGTELEERYIIPRSAIVVKRYSPFGGPYRECLAHLAPVDNPYPDVLDIYSDGPRPKSSGCLVIFLAILTPVGFLLVCMLT